MPVDPHLRCRLLSMLRAADAQGDGAALAESWFADSFGHRVACSDEDIADLTDTLHSIFEAGAEAGLDRLRRSEAAMAARAQLLREMRDSDI